METFGGLNLLDFTTGASGRLGFGRFGICDNERYTFYKETKQFTDHI